MPVTGRHQPACHSLEISFVVRPVHVSDIGVAAALQMQIRNMQQQQQQAAHLHAQRMMQAHQQQLAMAHQAQHRSTAPGAGMAHAGLPASAYRGSFANAASQASRTHQEPLRGASVAKNAGHP